MSNLIYTISENLSEAQMEQCKQNVKAMVAQEVSHLNMIAFDDMRQISI